MALRPEGEERPDPAGCWNGVRSDLIFDASSWPLKDSGEGRTADPELARYMKPGHIMTRSVTLRVALVDELGQRP